MRWWGVGLWIVGCSGVASGPVLGPDGASARCPDGAASAARAPGEGEERWLDDTEVTLCLDAAGRPTGPHVERWADGAVAAEGAWKDGLRDGTWIAWYPDGAFRAQISWRDGRQDGERLEIGSDGRIVRMELREDVVTELGTLAADAEMPEWGDGGRIRGTRYREHADATP
ncbi:MAG: hypothetical protein R3F59_13980 [Myxococcota bacterium]